MATYPRGQSPASAPVEVRALDVPSAANPVTLSWNRPAGATSYSVLRTTNAATFSRPCTCLVGTTTGAQLDDTGGALTTFTHNAVGGVSGSMTLDNFGFPRVEWVPRIGSRVGWGPASMELGAAFSWTGLHTFTRLQLSTAPLNSLLYSNGTELVSDPLLLWSGANDQLIVGDNDVQRTIIYGDNTDERRIIGRYGTTGTPAAITANTSILEISTVLSTTGATFWNNIQSTFDQTGGTALLHGYGFSGDYSGTGQGGGVIGTIGCDAGGDCFGAHFRVKDQDLADTGANPAHLFGVFGEVDKENAGGGKLSYAFIAGNLGAATATTAYGFDRGSFSYGMDFAAGFSFAPTFTSDVIRLPNNLGISTLNAAASGDNRLLWSNASDQTTLNTPAGASILFAVAESAEAELTASRFKTSGVSAMHADSSNVASATTVALPDGNLFHITGTTSITTINTCDSTTNGRIVWLIFDGVLTVTDGSNLVLNGNFATTANDTLVLGCDGTNWFEMSRSPN